MIDRNELKELFTKYGYSCLHEYTDHIVFMSESDSYLGVEIVCLNKLEQAKLDSMVDGFRSENYSVRVCDLEKVSSIEDYLFDWRFQVEKSNKKIEAHYNEYTSNVMRAYGIDSNQLSTAHYEYVQCPYTVERELGNNEKNEGNDIITSLRKELEGNVAKLIIIEAPAGYGKTSTAMELLHSYANVTTKVRPFYMALSKDRQAPTFYYLLISQINKQFKVLLGDSIVTHNIKAGRIPLIIDGFDELLSEDLDRGYSKRDKNRGQTMLETITALLEGNAKIVLTTRKTAILSGEEFYDWYDQTTSNRQNFQIVRYKLEQPKIENWLDADKLRILPSHFKDISNPVLLGYLHFLNHADFLNEANSVALVKNYIERLLNREVERQNLPFKKIEEQQLIYERQASAFAYDDITCDTRKNIKENILLLSSDIINNYATPEKDADSIANSLTNHALFDRKGDNNIGYINDFVLGLFIGYALIDKEYKALQEYYENMSPRFIDKVILAMSACEEADRECACLRLEEQCHNLTSNLKLLAEIKLLNETRSVFSDTYLEGAIIPCVNFLAPSQFSNCSFVNCDFSNSRIDFSIFSSCTFINCRFNQVKIQGETEGVYFFDCIKDGVSFDPNFKEDTIEEELEPASICSIERKILLKYFPKGSKRRKMQYISRLKNDFEDSRQFKKTFNFLVTHGYILTNGDQSHISDAGIDYLNK